jgi:CheY-like chemotaxis protein
MSRMKDSPKKRILIIEDEIDVSTYLQTVFEDSGYEVDTAENGIEAMKKIQNQKPDLISLDISLPERTGVNIYCELKNDPELSDIPVVMVTGIHMDFKKLINSRKDLPPPDGYIAKPFQVAELQDTISRLLH